MQLHILASGSTGNAALIELGGKKFLIDAGISTRRIEMGLAQAGIAVSDLDGLLITHEHYDHIKGITVLVKRHRMPVYARAAVWESVSKLNSIPAECRHELGERLEIGPVKITPFPISHDAADPVGFCFYYRKLKWVIATDMGVITRGAAEALAYADLAVLEANHDLEMLQTGPYPPYLKKRIKSKYGHLSNHDAGKILAHIPRQREMQVFLAHLSQQNNNPHLAETTVSQVLQTSGCAVGEEIILHRTYPDSLVSWVE